MKSPKKILCLLAVIAICWASASPAVIVNPSFEYDEPGNRHIPTGWTLKDRFFFGRGIYNSFATHGNQNFKLWSYLGRDYEAGSRIGLLQTVDLTGITHILFDVRLSAHNDPVPSTFQDYEALFLVDDVPLWSESGDGTYMDVSVDVSVFSGVHTIELRQSCIQDDSYFPSCWSEWDNFRAVPEPGTILLLSLGALAAVRRSKKG